LLYFFLLLPIIPIVVLGLHFLTINIIIIIIIIIIISRNELGLDRPVSGSSNSHFQRSSKSYLSMWSSALFLASCCYGKNIHIFHLRHTVHSIYSYLLEHPHSFSDSMEEEKKVLCCDTKPHTRGAAHFASSYRQAPTQRHCCWPQVLAIYRGRRGKSKYRIVGNFCLHTISVKGSWRYSKV